LSCRRDYINPNKLWKKLGFVPQSEKQGRRRSSPSELTFWWYDYNQKTLFDVASDDKYRIVIDANIFFDFINPHNRNEETLALQADWLQE
ncbi:MAG TPA: hypothetical protein PLZ51_00135, partial [Aggregatilineales bacterium]|nr:hypothetical protein [Aggregatilineales bacterium]